MALRTSLSACAASALGGSAGANTGLIACAVAEKAKAQTRKNTWIFLIGKSDQTLLGNAENSIQVRPPKVRDDLNYNRAIEGTHPEPPDSVLTYRMKLR